MIHLNGWSGKSALTRHQQKVWLVASDAAEQTEVRKHRAINDVRPVTLDDKWAQVARALSYQAEEDNAVAMFERVASIRRGAVRTFHDLAAFRQVRQTAPDLAQQQRQERSVPDELRAMVRQAVEQVRHVAEQARAWRHDRGQGLGR
jgi:hypothetical protein